MSAIAQQTEALVSSPAFKAAEAEAKPTRYCVGTVSDVGESKPTQSGTYIWQQFSIEADENGTSTKVGICYRPEWLVRDFDPASLKLITEKDNPDDKMTIGEKLYNQYSNHIYCATEISTLQGLAGSDEAFAELSRQLVTPTVRDPKEIEEVFRKFFLESNNGLTFGYTLRQGQEKFVKEDGSNGYRNTKYYEVDGLWYDTAENRKGKAKAAQAAAKKGKRAFITFEV